MRQCQRYAAWMLLLLCRICARNRQRRQFLCGHYTISGRKNVWFFRGWYKKTGQTKKDGGQVDGKAKFCYNKQQPYCRQQALQNRQPIAAKQNRESCPSGRWCSTRNAVSRKGPRVRIPNSPPKAPQNLGFAGLFVIVVMPVRRKNRG